MCLVLLVPNLLPLFSNLIALVLSYSMILFPPKFWYVPPFRFYLSRIPTIWASKNNLAQLTSGMASYTPYSLASVELFATSPCVQDPDIKTPFPIVTEYPVWLFMSICTANAASILQIRDPESFRPIIRGSAIDSQRYLITLVSFL